MFTILQVFEEGKRLVKFQLRFSQFMCVFFIMVVVAASFSFLPRVSAEMNITDMVPTQGPVGQSVALTSNLTTSNGSYEIRFDDSVVASGNASGNSVSTSFVVPETTAGNHTVRVFDLTTGDNASLLFSVTTSYFLNVVTPESPRQLQEGDSVNVWVNVTGGDSSTTYVANVTVVAPNNASFVKMVNLPTSIAGTGSATASYPNDFTNANTSLVGNYGVSFNDTLGTGAFYVGLTNSTEYHRFEPVDVKAVYSANEDVNLTVTGKGVYASVNLTADSGGIVHYTDFVVPPNASIGSYMVQIVSVSEQPTVKTPQDVQNFTVPGFQVSVTPKNLAGEPVPEVAVRAFENETLLGSYVSNSTGTALLSLEIGNYTLEGYYKSQKVGERDLEVIGISAVDLTCNLTNLGIRVIAITDSGQVNIPEASVYVTPENVSYTTDITGEIIVHSLIPNVTYTLNASRYGVPFNTTIIPQLLAQDGSAVPWVNLTFTCPVYSLQVNVTRAGGQSVSNAVVKIQDLLGGLFTQGSTDTNGIVLFRTTLGKYMVSVYDNSSGLKLNETQIDLFQDQNLTVTCSLYGLTVTVKVTDYFGQALANMKVTLQREGLSLSPATTQGDGTATFNNIIGGDVPFQIAVYVGDQTQPTVALEQSVENSTTVNVRLDKYVTLGGFLVETSQFAIAILIILTVILLGVLEVYRFRRARHKKTES